MKCAIGTAVDYLSTENKRDLWFSGYKSYSVEKCVPSSLSFKYSTVIPCRKKKIDLFIKEYNLFYIRQYVFSINTNFN